MRYLNGLFFSLLILLTLSACDDGSTNGDPVDNKPNDSTIFHPLMSLKVGNTWDYRITDYNPDSSVIDNPYSDQWEIMRDTVIGGVKTYLIDADDGDYIGYANKEDGLYFWSSEDNWNQTLNRMVKYPVVKGELYHINMDPTHPQGSTYTVSVEETNVDVTVPAGTFKCVKIKMTNDESGSWQIEYFSKNIGLIKGERMDSEEEGSPFYLSSKIELINKNF